MLKIAAGVVSRLEEILNVPQRVRLRLPAA
jgi:hypothetical protein